MGDMFHFVGTVRDGVGGASRDTQRGIYPPELLGFTPYAGSLNLNVEPEDLHRLKQVRYDFAVHYAGTIRPMWHAYIANTYPCVIQWHSEMPDNVIEIFAVNHLRSWLMLINGDALPVTVPVFLDDNMPL
jgi:CTP-dependent riboflavin kinase